MFKIPEGLEQQNLINLDEFIDKKIKPLIPLLKSFL
jgi:hypothetical protein